MMAVNKCVQMNKRLPAYVKAVIGTLESAGHEAYVVGGCVRDSLLGVRPDDWDVCTSALPRETAAIFSGSRIIETGMKHGTVTVLLQDENGQSLPVEITTFRVDGEYSDNRRPDSVLFTDSLQEDLKRRDFTVNAMAYNPKRGLSDFFDGAGDLKRRLIRCVGDANERFYEDGLRILRALRFASRLGFGIDGETSAAIHGKRYLLKNIAGERCGKEILKMLCGNHAGAMIGEYADVLDVVMPGFGAAEIAETACGFERINQMLCVGEALDETARLALLLTGCETCDRESMLRGLKLSNKLLDNSLQAARFAATELPQKEKSLRRLLGKVGIEQTRRILMVKKVLGEDVAWHEAAMETIEGERQCYSMSALAVDGRDMMALGFLGRAIGGALARLLDMVIDGEIENSKDALLKKAKELLRDE